MLKTEPFFGWTMPSRDAIRRAERALESGEKTVRDEVGFSSIHDAYADRFFPGTSVQHTRLRYALFVPWIYRRLIARGVKQALERELAREEVTLVRRLSALEERGVIGRTIQPRPAKQPPSIIYWSALGTWGLLRHDEESPPTRATVHHRIEAQASTGRKSSVAEFKADEVYEPFYSLPSVPENWEDANSPLVFTLDPDEREYLSEKFCSVRKIGGRDLSLLARLVEARTVPNSMYSREVIHLADQEDRRALRQARYAASLGAVGRAIYAAILETLCETQDRRESISSMHREHLRNKILPEHRNPALQIDLDELRLDVPRMTETLAVVLKETCRWLRGPMTDLIALRDCYAESERRRKNDRARLPSTGIARERRNEWHPEDTTLADALHYRWPTTRQHLKDLL
jgi:hypothetical protein